MDAWYTDRHNGHHGHGELIGGQLLSGFELPVRAERVRDAFVAAGLGAVHSPRDLGREPILAVHDADYVAFLETAWKRWRALGRTHPALGMVWHAGMGMPHAVPEHIEGALGYYSMDAGCAIVEGTWDAAYWSAQCAVNAADAVAAGATSAMAICRPPGHHAATALMGGYCYLNNAAIAVQRLLDAGRRRIGVLDIDYHHGNGTQAIFWHRSDVMFTSIHASPHDDYPYLSGHADERGAGDGTGFNLNLPLPAGTQAPAWLAAQEQAIDAIVAAGCDAVVVSLGVDTFERDPISRFALRMQDYREIGARMQRLRLPVLFVFEGGYATDEVGTNAVSVLQGFALGRIA
ncbi:MAG: histone deacetylase family protein [Aquabacterium sp.]